MSARSATTPSSSPASRQPLARQTCKRFEAHGWDDRAIHDAIQVIAYFNYINRIADGVGIDPEPDWTEGS